MLESGIDEVGSLKVGSGGAPGGFPGILALGPEGAGAGAGTGTGELLGGEVGATIEESVSAGMVTRPISEFDTVAGNVGTVNFPTVEPFSSTT